MAKEEQQEFEFAVNEAAIYFDNDHLVVAFADGKMAMMEIENDNERKVVRDVLADANTWAAFLSSLSQALRQHVS